MILQNPPPPWFLQILASIELRFPKIPGEQGTPVAQLRGDSAHEEPCDRPGGDSGAGDISKKLLPTMAGTHPAQIWASSEALRAELAGPGWMWGGKDRDIINSCKVYVPLQGGKKDHTEPLSR